ncbi:hypothetical protein J4450_06745 [Candidatus Micrarchaeota archaeon]|nr:hypothetical protein [Candidatus Micrarchaeota archaeon]
MKFADNVPYYVRARVQREIANVRRTFSKDITQLHQKARFEFRLSGNTTPLVEDPFTPMNILARKSTPSEENRRRTTDEKMQLAPYAARCIRSFQEVFRDYPEVVTQLEQNEGDFDFVLCRATPLDDSGRLTALPRILEVHLSVGDTSRRFTEETHPEIMRLLAVMQVFTLPATGNHFVSNVVEDFTNMDYTIRIEGNPNQTDVLTRHISDKLSSKLFSIRKILVVSDLQLAGRLGELGFEVVAADNSYVAERLRAGQFDLLITDVLTQSDGPQGFELIRLAKGIQPTLKTILLSLAANTRLSYSTDAVNGYVEKKSSFFSELLGIIDLLACD